MNLIWPQEGFCRGYRLLSLQEMSKIKTYFQNKNREMADFPEVIGKGLLQLDARIKPHLFCERWFPFAESAGSLYLMLDYDPNDAGMPGQVISYIHNLDFIEYVAPDITEILKRTESVIKSLSINLACADCAAQRTNETTAREAAHICRKHKSAPDSMESGAPEVSSVKSAAGIVAAAAIVAVAVAAAVAAVIAAAPAAIAAATPDDDQQNDDPAAVSAAKAVIAHMGTSYEFLAGRTGLNP